MTKVYHVQIGDEHFYFGSKKAIFDTFGKAELGIGYTSFRNVKNLETIPYRNKKCIIREGVLVQATNMKRRAKEDSSSDKE